jgi:hypothetical protein
MRTNFRIDSFWLDLITYSNHPLVYSNMEFDIDFNPQEIVMEQFFYLINSKVMTLRINNYLFFYDI